MSKKYLYLGNIQDFSVLKTGQDFSVIKNLFIKRLFGHTACIYDFANVYIISNGNARQSHGTYIRR